MTELTVYGAIGAPGGERTLAWVLLDLALERELGLKRTPEILREPGGRPYFPDCPDLWFNISHSRGGAVCALDRQAGHSPSRASSRSRIPLARHQR